MIHSWRRYLMALAFPLVGCSMHPLPENFPLNFPRASTFDIVQKVRCEAKAGLDRFKNSRHQDHLRQIIAATRIGYDFEFVMTENNNATEGKLHFAGRPTNKASNRKLDIELTGEATKERTNRRTFRIVEDLRDVANADCSAETLRANLAYPISGSLRVDDLVYTYVRLERMSNLGDPEGQDDNIAIPSDDDDPRKRAGVFSEHLEFTTTLKLGANPILTMTAVAGSFRLTNARIKGRVKRNDVHDVIIAFAQDPAFHNREVRRAVRQRNLDLGRTAAGGVEKRVLLGRDLEGMERRLVATAQGRVVGGALEKKIIRGPRLETGLAQANAAARNKVVLELARLRNLKDNEQEGPKFLGQRLLTFLRPPDETGTGD
jgi:hypothetical protein